MSGARKPEQTRWEPCPTCHDGFPRYLGLADTVKGRCHQFECSQPECGRYVQVAEGKGAFDLQIGSHLDPDGLYFEHCQRCNRLGVVKVVNYRFVCANCLI